MKSWTPALAAVGIVLVLGACQGGSGPDSAAPLVSETSVGFAACPTSSDPFSPVTGLEVTDQLNSASGVYLSPEELLAIGCVWAPDTKLMGDSGSLAEDWASGMSGSDGFQMGRVRAVGLTPGSGTSAEGVAIYEADPIEAAGLRLEWSDGRWLITEWMYFPPCSKLTSVLADPDLPSSAADAIAVECP